MKKQIVIDIRLYGLNSLLGSLWHYFHSQGHLTIPTNIFGWKNKDKKEYEFYIIVPVNDIERCQEECKKLELRSFTILSNEGMIIGG